MLPLLKTGIADSRASAYNTIWARMLTKTSGKSVPMIRVTLGVPLAREVQSAMRHQFQAVLFDFDYTLADSSRGVAECVNFALNRLGLPPASYKAICQTIGLPLSDAFVRLAGQKCATRSEEFARFFAERADEVVAGLTVVYDTAAPAVRRLKQNGLKLGIVSTKFRYRIESVLKREGLLEAFDVIIGAEDVAQDKPDPAGLQRARERLNSLPGQTLYVGDSVIDAETARRGGTPFVAVLSGVTSREDFSQYSVMEIVEDLTQLADWLVN